jgi:hypothetical protein
VLERKEQQGLVPHHGMDAAARSAGRRQERRQEQEQAKRFTRTRCVGRGLRITRSMGFDSGRVEKGRGI